MKKLFFLIFIVFCIRLGGLIDNCQCQWQWVNPTLNTSTINHTKYADENTLYMTQEYGNILKSTDKGINWIKIKSDSSNIFGSIWFFNANTGIVTGYKDGKTNLIKTTDGGISWNTVFNSNYKFIPSSIYFLNNNTGYLGGTYSNLYKTTNAGNNWDSAGFLRDTLFNLSNIYFKNPNTGFITGWNEYQNQCWGRIFKTINGGLNWTYISTSNIPASIQFINDTGFVFCGFNLLKTFNLGADWFTIKLDNSQSIQDSKFVNSQTGFIVGRDPFTTQSISISKTTNGGVNWQQSIPIGFYELYTIDNYGENNLITSGQGGTIVRTTNCGINWISNSFYNQSFCDLAFPNPNTGYVFSTNSYIKTTNSGLNWIIDSIPNSYNRNLQETSIKFINVNTGFILKDSIYKTTNGGQNWNKIYLGNNRKLRTFSFINENTGFVIAYYDQYPYPTNMYLEKTTNSGLSWQETQYSNVINLYKINFFDENTGYAYFQSSSNAFLKTTDGGLNWFNIVLEDTFRKIFFINSTKGFVFGENGLLLTTNGGNNFARVLIDSQVSGCDINFIDNFIGYYIEYKYVSFGGNFIIYKTTDGGYNWNQHYQFNKNEGFVFIHFNDENTGYGFGAIGTIMKTTNGGGFVNVNQISSQVPFRFMLYQNYPNPFNPTTIIKYSIPPFNSPISKGGLRGVTLKVYDMLGREVVTLVNEKQSPGTYEVTFDARHGGSSSLASGIYFYKLTVRDHEFPRQIFSETKKLVLLK
jgi:photosystem II stability/assembly factor-like uncharacterized protein